MKILAIGDVVGERTVSTLASSLWRFRRENGIDFVVANAENASEIRGLSSAHAKTLLDAGVDVITLGNHAFGKKDLYPMLESDPRIVRPANFPASAPGLGYTFAEANGYRILCMNVLGRAFMDTYENPFDTVEKILARESGKYDFSLLDIHAEATSEKLALARFFDGRINVIFGTHTHVTTADEQKLPGGTLYQTDLGMSGPVNGIIGTNAEDVIKKFRTLMPTPFTVADGEIQIHATVFDLSGVASRVVF